MSAYKKCQFCGETIDANSTFCSHCKSALNQPATLGSKPVSPPSPPARSREPGVPPPAPTPPGPPTAPPRASTPPVPPAAAPSVPIQPAAPPPPQMSPSAASAHYQASQPGRKGSGSLIAIVLALILLLGGGGAAVYYLFLKPADPPAISSILPNDTTAEQQSENQPVQQQETQGMQQQEANQSFIGNFEAADGIYQGSAPGMYGPLLVEVTVSDGAITKIEVLDHSETPAYFIESYPLVTDLIIAEQSLDIDTKTGATISADAIIEAVQDALSGSSQEEGGAEQ